MARRTIIVHDETWDQLYAIKGPRRTFEDAIKSLIEAVYPPLADDQTDLIPTCPHCDEELNDDATCPGCGYIDNQDTGDDA